MPRKPHDELDTIVLGHKKSQVYLVDREGNVSKFDKFTEAAKVAGTRSDSIYSCAEGHIYNGYRAYHTSDFDPEMAVKNWNRDYCIQQHARGVRKTIVCIDLDTEKAIMLHCDVATLAKEFCIYTAKFNVIVRSAGILGNAVWMYSDVYDKMVETNKLKDYMMVARYLLKLSNTFDAMYSRKQRMLDSVTKLLE